MADTSVVLDLMSGGSVVAVDNIGGTSHQEVKIEFGGSGTATPVSAGNPLPTSVINGTVAVNTPGTITSGSVVITDGTVKVVTPGTITSGSIVITAGTVGTVGNIGQVNNAGTLAGGTLGILTDGTVRIPAGTVSVNTPGTITSGTVSVNAGTIGAGTLNTLGTLTNLAHGTIENSGTVTGVGVVSAITNGSIVVTAGTVGDTYLQKNLESLNGLKLRTTQFSLLKKTVLPAPSTVSGNPHMAFDGVNTIYIYSPATGNSQIYSYNILTDTLTALTNGTTLAEAYAGATILYANGKLYFTRGGGFTGWYSLNTDGSSYTTLTSSTNGTNFGCGLVWNGADYIYMRNATPALERYSISGNSWSSMTAPGSAGAEGLSLVMAGTDRLYSLQGGGTTGFSVYNITLNTWTAKTATPGNIYDGGSLAWNGDNYIYAFQGNGATTMYRYDILANTWDTLLAMPVMASTGSGMVAMKNGMILCYLTDPSGITAYGIFNNLYVFEPTQNSVIRGRYNSTQPTLVTGQQGELQLSSDASLVNAPDTATEGAADGISNTIRVYKDAFGFTPNQKSMGWYFDPGGTTWARVRGDGTNGAYVNVKAMVNIPGGTIQEVTNGSIKISAGTVSVNTPGTITSGTISVNTPGTITSGTVAINAGTVGGKAASGAASIANPVQIAGTDSGGTIYSPLVTAAGAIGSIVNIGTVKESGTTTGVGTVSGVGVVSQITNGSIVITAGTVTSLASGTTIGTINAGTINSGTINAGTINSGTINAGTVTINGGTVQINPVPAKLINTIGSIWGTTSGTAGTLVAAPSSGSAIYMNDLSIINEGTSTLTAGMGFGTNQQGTVVLARAAMGGNGGVQKSFPSSVNGAGTQLPLVIWTTGSGTAAFTASYWIAL